MCFPYPRIPKRNYHFSHHTRISLLFLPAFGQKIVILPGYFSSWLRSHHLRAALTSPNYELSEDEKKELKKLDPAKRREKIIEKINNKEKNKNSDKSKGNSKNSGKSKNK